MSFRTADFQDSNNNGKDDRDEKANRQRQTSASKQGLYQGNINFGSILSGIYGNKPSEDDDEGRAMKNAFAYDTASKYFDSNLAMGMADFQSGIAKENMRYASQLAQQEQSNARYEEFNYGMHALDKQYEIANQFANQNYNRDIGYLGASGEQTRKNYKAAGVESRLQTITEGEQNRLQTAAEGDQDRKTMTHEDKLIAGKERRHNARARATARSF